MRYITAFFDFCDRNGVWFAWANVAIAVFLFITDTKVSPLTFIIVSGIWVIMEVEKRQLLWKLEVEKKANKPEDEF